ncbi:MAG TPA: hypothetical protein VHK22_08115 [Gaiellaceae bacterium]|nr:hypothetical protein [Gaiellaceae bacterium]
MPKKREEDRATARRHAELLRRAASGELQAVLAAARSAERRAALARLRARPA